MLVYLAGSIDAAERELATGWRRAATHYLNGKGVGVFDPASAFRLTGTRLDAVQPVNDAAIQQADALLVELYHPVRHVGTLMELGAALHQGKPVYLWMGEQYANHASLMHPGINRYYDLEDALEALMQGLYSRALEHPASGGVQFLLDTAATGGVDDPALFPVPSRAYHGDAGFDLPTAVDVTIEGNSFLDVPLAYRVAPPPTHWWRLTGRSSTLRKWGLLVNEGIMDSGYRGPCFAGVWNMTDQPVSVPAGTRLVQCILHPVDADNLSTTLVTALRPGSRGVNGFGSSGK